MSDPDGGGPDTASRLEKIEVKLGLAEDLLDELNTAVYRQQRRIDELEAEVRALRRQLLQSMPAEPRNPQDEVPPHY